MIERDGALYDEAIDPVECNRIYIETDIYNSDQYSDGWEVAV